MPQLYMLQTTGEVRSLYGLRVICLLWRHTAQAENITAHYLFALGAYRGLYIVNWVYRYFAEDYLDMIASVAGLIQTILYADFFYIYVTRVLKGKRFELPK